jgi:hypothetical protein
MRRGECFCAQRQLESVRVGGRVARGLDVRPGGSRHHRVTVATCLSAVCVASSSPVNPTRLYAPPRSWVSPCSALLPFLARTSKRGDGVMAADSECASGARGKSQCDVFRVCDACTSASVQGSVLAHLWFRAVIGLCVLRRRDHVGRALPLL